MRALAPLTLALTGLLTISLGGCDKPQSCDPACGEEGGSETGASETGETGDGDGDPACDGDTPIVVLDTSLGTMVVQLDAVRAPITVDNFLAYVETGFYDGTIFHRVIDNFVIQGGGYEPGLVLEETMGPIPLEIDPELRHVDGAIAMARNQAPDTAESQWYICDGAQPSLDDSYAVFGVIIDGFDVRNAISSVETTTVPFMGIELKDVPVEDVVLDSAYCVEDWP